MEENSEVTLARKVKFDELEDTLVYFATSIIRNNTEEEILWDLAKNCISRLGFVDCVIYKIDYLRKELVQKAAYGPKNPRSHEILQPIKIALGKGITGAVGLSGEAEIVADTSVDSRYIVDDEVRLSEIAVPIVLGDRVWGVIDCEHPERGFFTNQHLRTLSAVASICAVKIAKLKVEQELSRKKELLLSTERQLLDLRVKSFKAQMNPHFLFNALNSIQYFITADKKGQALRYHALFSKLIRKYLYHLDREMIVFEEELKIIKWYLKLQQLRYEEKLYFDLEVEEQLFAHPVPSLVLQLMVEDAVEKNVIENKGKVWLQLKFVKQAHALMAGITVRMETAAQTGREFYETYRYESFTWENHVEILNRLKGFKIRKEISQTDLEGETQITYQLTIPLQL